MDHCTSCLVMFLKCEFGLGHPITLDIGRPILVVSGVS